jgi:hypothetical protein
LTYNGTNLFSTGSITLDTNLGIFFSGLGATNAGVYGRNSGAELAFNASGSEQMRLTSTGLGIGTSSPAAKLDVQTSGVGIQLKQSTAGSATYYVMENTIETGGKRWRFGYTGAAGIPTFSLYNQTDNVTAWVADASGNLGLGVTPSGWGSPFLGAFEGKAGTALVGRSDAAQTFLFNNLYFNGTNYIRKATGYGNFILLDGFSGGMGFNIIGTGSAGSTASPTQAMTLDASGRLGVGSTSPECAIDVLKASSTDDAGRYSIRSFDSTSAASGVGGGIAFTGYVTGTSGAANFATIQGIKENSTSGNFASAMVFTTRANGAGLTERARIDSSGTVLVNTTSTSTGIDTTATKLFVVAPNSNFGAAFTAVADSQGRTIRITDQSRTVIGALDAGSSSVNLGTNSTHPLVFNTAGSERARIDESGNFGIGTSSPSYRLDIRGVPSNSAYSQVNISGTGSARNLIYGDNDGILILSADTGNVGTGSYMGFNVDGSERARINSSGNFMVGATSFAAYGTTTSYTNTTLPSGRFVSGPSVPDGNIGLMVDKYSSTNTTSQWFLGFTIDNTTVASGVITANGASQAAFGAWSDRRLKENIVDLPPQLANIMALRPVEFDYIASEGGGHQISFIAQEFEQVYPDAVGERQDGMKTLTGWAKTEARLVKAIQEQQAIIESLKARLDAANL